MSTTATHVMRTAVGRIANAIAQRKPTRERTEMRSEQAGRRDESEKMKYGPYIANPETFVQYDCTRAGEFEPHVD